MLPFVLFLGASVLVFWSLAGYPLFLVFLGRFRRNTSVRALQPSSEADLPFVSVLLPVSNGDQWVAAKLDSILSLKYPRHRMEILVASDGSTDNTEAIVSDMACTYGGIRLFRLPRGGKASALNVLMQHASGDIIFFTDVRQKLDPRCLSLLVSRFSDPQVGGVCGELTILDGETEEELSVGLYWKIEKWIRRQLSRNGTLLVVTGCLYAVRRSLAVPLPTDALGDDIFMPQAILRRGYLVVFEDGSRAYDYPTTADVEFRRKVRTLAALYQYIGRHGLGPYPFHFFSYKVTRLLLPWALLAAALSTPFLPSGLILPASSIQAFVYLAALADPLIPERFPLKRISSPARVFCMLMAAAMFSVSILFRPADSLWKPTTVRVPGSSGSHSGH